MHYSAHAFIYFIGETVGISHTTASESGVFLACIPVASLIASTVILKKKPTKQQVAGILMTLAGAVVFVILAFTESILQRTVYELVTFPIHNRGFLTAILYQGIGCSVLAFFLSNVAIAKIGVNRTSCFIGVATVVSIVAGALLLRESFTIGQIIGAVIIIVGVYTANVGPMKIHR